MKWNYTSLSEYPQKPDICLVETSDSYKLLWFNHKNEWWYDCDTHKNLMLIILEILNGYILMIFQKTLNK